VKVKNYDSDDVGLLIKTIRTTLNNDHQLCQSRRKFCTSSRYFMPVRLTSSICIHPSRMRELVRRVAAMNKRTTTNAKHHGECVDPDNFNPPSVRNSIERRKDESTFLMLRAERPAGPLSVTCLKKHYMRNMV